MPTFITTLPRSLKVVKDDGMPRQARRNDVGMVGQLAATIKIYRHENVTTLPKIHVHILIPTYLTSLSCVGMIDDKTEGQN